MPRRTRHLAPRKYDPELLSQFAVADGIATLFAPHVEVVVHDLSTETIAYIANSMSHRDVGDPSQLGSLNVNTAEAVVGPYDKTNADGRRFKSVTIALRNATQKPVGLLCINLDISAFEKIWNALEGFLLSSRRQDEVKALFAHDWHETINRFVAKWTAENRIQLSQLDKMHRRQLIEALHDQGAFEGRRATPYVARLLGVSRATIYSELASLRGRT